MEFKKLQTILGLLISIVLSLAMVNAATGFSMTPSSVSDTVDLGDAALTKTFTIANTVAGLNLTISKTNFNLFFRSDNASLARLGVPSHTFSTTPIDVDKEYHQTSDEAETLNITVITQTIQAVAKGTESIIKGIDTPSRVVIEEKRVLPRSVETPTAALNPTRL